MAYVYVDATATGNVVLTHTDGEQSIMLTYNPVEAEQIALLMLDRATKAKTYSGTAAEAEPS